MTKHTPGPWEVYAGPEDKPELTVNYISRDGQVVEVADCNSVYVAPEHRIANSLLIAAAPDLLEALLDMWNLINVDVSTDTIKAGTTFKTARAAIAKATGKEV